MYWQFDGYDSAAGAGQVQPFCKNVGNLSSDDVCKTLIALTQSAIPPIIPQLENRPLSVACLSFWNSEIFR